MARHDSNLDEEKRSYGALWLVLSLFLFVTGLWAIADDNVFRRPWKRYQAEFGRLEIDRLKDAIAKEQTAARRRPGLPGGQQGPRRRQGKRRIGRRRQGDRPRSSTTSTRSAWKTRRRT